MGDRQAQMRDTGFEVVVATRPRNTWSSSQARAGIISSVRECVTIGLPGGFTMWKGATVAAAFLLLGACAQDKEQNKAQTEEFAKAAGEAAAQIAQQDDARCQSYGKPGSAAYIDCRTSLKSDRAEMKK